MRVSIVHILATVVFTVSSVMLTAQESPVIMTIDDTKVTQEEFENIYKKNNKDSVITEEALDEYVELFINFKLKVKEAERLQMDTNPDFKAELAGYRKQLARPYLVDNEMTDQLLKEAYERLKTEVDASHILMIAKPDASPEDTLKAYNTLKDVRKKIIDGKMTFSDAAMTYSQDPSAQSNEGRLGYFTSLQMVYPFENAAYNTEVGEISDIVRSRFGYHILKVHDKREARGEIRVAHIMVKVDQTADEATTEKAKAKIEDIYDELESGTDFDQLARQHSDDKSSSRNGGELPWFGTGKMVQEFEDTAFSLENDGDFSRPFRTSYGWHIVKRLERKGIESYDDMERNLKQRINKDVRSQMSTRSFVKKVKDEYGFKEKVKNLDPVQALADSTLLKGSWRPGDTSKMTAWLFQIGDKKYTQDDFIYYLRASQGRSRETDLRKYVADKYDLFKQKSLIDYEDSKLEQKYPDFRALMKEYRDGILLFELTDQKVWTKAVRDTTGLKQYYEDHKEDFMYDERVEGTIFRCKDKATAERVREMILSGDPNDEIEKTVNSESQLDLTITSGKYEADEGTIAGLIEFEKGISDIHEIDDQWVFMQVKEVLPPSPRPFDKIKGLVTAAYQNQLEKEWIEELRGRYTVKVDKDVLYSVK
ncbi:MAG: peptidylprolyl isomerase [Flavobacteriales bacterium]|nr:peptidylprolyl isomerase [Flavobacteriales bacterium]